MAGRYSPRSVDADDGWVKRRFRELADRVDSVSESGLSSVPGSQVTIQQILADPAESIYGFKNTDSYVYDGVAADVRIPLSKAPIPGSEQPFWKADAAVVGGLGLPPGSWAVVGPELVIDDAGLMAEFAADDLFWVDYAYDKTATIPPIPDLLVGFVGDLTVDPGYTGTQNADSLNIVVAQGGETVTATRDGTLTSVTMGRQSGSFNGKFRVVTGTVSGTNFTVSAVSPELDQATGTTDGFALTVPCSVPILEGEYIALYLRATSPAEIAYVNPSTGSNWGYAGSIGGVPAPTDVITFGNNSSFLLAVQATDA